MNVITPELLSQAMTYAEYRDLADRLAAEGKTTGPNQSEDLVRYTELNGHRMRRLEKTTHLSEELIEALQKAAPQVWVVLTEAWCGDAAQNVPVLAKMADATPQVELKLLLRDEHPDVMDAYLTNGGRSIPKLVAVRADSYVELGVWGPRPEPVQEMVMDFKKTGDGDYATFVEEVQKWYAHDKTQTVQQEFLELLPHWR